jgi:hypothetical protein
MHLLVRSIQQMLLLLLKHRQHWAHQLAQLPDQLVLCHLQMLLLLKHRQHWAHQLAQSLVQ